ncbi:protein of unknown function [Quadrisphaera granulorum]|uniref:Uncharacterized protein DUF1206 n=1 Tax=Quadrisphaera granulorum TaxID=317664 RepID=A0A316AWS9_9ACTN|nr:DUF1206 domain-containing protein [Quadrisphaera granulorum]PWJ54627.1 uncharacterized protein DUF1206 [Quadrisphaera granulorum]SZE95989.1 protein of unknown function [Quadrisphaera granulorum]
MRGLADRLRAWLDRDGDGEVSDDVEDGARAAREHLEPVARVGYALSGALHVLIGALAVRLALGVREGTADQGGALAAVAGTPGGAPLLWAASAALAALALWHLVDGVLELRWRQRADGVKDLAKGVVYSAVVVTAVTYAAGGETDAEDTSDDVTEQLMENVLGTLAVVAAGVAVLGVGLYLVVKGVRLRFREDLTLPEGPARLGVDVAGVVGYTAKGLALCVVGGLFVTAAATNDPREAGGLDAALRALLELPGGAVLLAGVGAGFAAYGGYAVVRARLGHL